MTRVTRLARRVRGSAFAADVRAAWDGVRTVAGLLAALLVLRGLIVAAALAHAAVTR